MDVFPSDIQLGDRTHSRDRLEEEGCLLNAINLALPLVVIYCMIELQLAKLCDTNTTYWSATSYFKMKVACSSLLSSQHSIVVLRLLAANGWEQSFAAQDFHLLEMILSYFYSVQYLQNSASRVLACQVLHAPHQYLLVYLGFEMRPSRSLLPPFLPKKVSYKIYQAHSNLQENLPLISSSYIQIILLWFGNRSILIQFMIQVHKNTRSTMQKLSNNLTTWTSLNLPLGAWSVEFRRLSSLVKNGFKKFLSIAVKLAVLLHPE